MFSISFRKHLSSAVLLDAIYNVYITGDLLVIDIMNQRSEIFWRDQFKEM